MLKARSSERLISTCRVLGANAMASALRTRAWSSYWRYCESAASGDLTADHAQPVHIFAVAHIDTDWHLVGRATLIGIQRNAAIADADAAAAMFNVARVAESDLEAFATDFRDAFHGDRRNLPVVLG